MESHKYDQYSKEDFAKDDDFIRWIIHSNDEDAFFWQAYLLKHPNKKKEVELAKEMILHSRDYFHKSHLAIEEVENIHSKIMEEVQQGRTIPFIKKVVPNSLKWIAVFLLITVSSLMVLWISQRNPQIVYRTAFAEIQHIVLPDGSHVKLNANSRLSFYGDWKKCDDRRVSLDGEAYFEVEKDLNTNCKFKVYTSNLTVEVLGTHFNVNSRSEKTRVVLSEGQIILNLRMKDSESILMQPGDLVDYTHANNELIQKRVKADLHSSWKEGIQLFEKASLEEIIKKMEELYGVRIEIGKEELLERNLTIGIPVQDLEIALKTLESVLNTTFKPIKENIYMLE